LSVEAADALDAEVDAGKRIRLTGTDEPAEADKAGGPATGMRPFQRDGSLFFRHTHFKSGAKTEWRSRPMECRPGCAACCIVISISSPIPGMPNGKPAGVPCVQLDENLRCKLFGRPERPAVCVSLKPSPEMCGSSAAEAFAILSEWESLTRP